MRVEAKHWLFLSLPFLGATLFLPVTRDGWDQDVDIPGFEAVIWIFIFCASAIVTLLSEPRALFHPELWSFLIWGVFLVVLFLTPFFVLGRLREDRPKQFRRLAAVSAGILILTWLKPLVWRSYEIQPIHLAGYKTLGIGVLCLTIALLTRMFRGNKSEAQWSGLEQVATTTITEKSHG